jgi:hypothetical protein
MSGGKEDAELLLIFVDIARGYSIDEYEGKRVYIKHFNLGDQVSISEHYQEVFKRAEKQGLPTEEGRLEVLDEEGFWTKGDEFKIEGAEKIIEEYLARRSKTIVKSQKATINKKIKEEELKLMEMQKKKSSLLHDTCESYADNKSSAFTVWGSLYSNKELSVHLYTKEEFDELSRAQLSDLVRFFNKVSSRFALEHTKRVSVLPTFTSYFNLIEGNMAGFFSRELLDLTFYQTSLLSYGRVFKSIFENYSDIPKGILRDPDAILDYAESQRENQGASKSSKSNDEHGAYSRMGASNQDMKDAGVSSGEAKDLHAIAKEKGGELSWEDFATG